jgi:hypothetical protein
MFKKDRIFWCATGIFVLAIILFAVTQNQLWLALMVASYLLRPTLASLGVGRRLVDERQMSIQYRSGNIAFTAMMVTAIVLAVVQNIKGDHSWELFNIVIIIGLATKALFNVLLVKNFREAGARIIMAVGLMVALFASMSHGLSVDTLVEAAPALAIVLIGWLSKRFPRTIGILVFAVTAVLLFVILMKGITIGQIATAVLICTPLILAGACLFVRDRDETDTEDETSKKPAIAG